MRSNLTRSVFRRLLSNKPLLCRCPHRLGHIAHRHNGVLSMLRSPTRRTLFGFSEKPARQIRETDMDPGLSTMLDLFMMDKVQARPPAAADLIRAFNMFFNHKVRIKEAVNNVQAQHALRTFRHLRDTNTTEEGFGITVSDLRTARDSMARVPADKLDTHNEFARELFAELRQRDPKIWGDYKHGTVGDFDKFICVLTLTGDSLEARTLVEELWDPDSTEKQPLIHNERSRLYSLVLQGFAKEMNETELINTARIAEGRGIQYTPNFHQTMTTFYAKKDDFEGTKSWYSKQIYQGHHPSGKTVAEVLQFCIRNNKIEWCNSVFRALIDSRPGKAIWDVVFEWAAGALGKGAEDVERMMEVMIRRNTQNEGIRPDIETINRLVKMAISRNNPYMAERYLALGLKLGIQPNAQTFILQMNYRIDADDLSGAQAAYVALQGMEVVDQDDLPVVNKYIRVLCSAHPLNYDRVASIVADIDERKVRLEANTVSKLCLMYLKRGELVEVIDVLQAHNFHYTLDERARIRDAILSYCFDRRNKTEDAWDAYTILRQMFDETDILIRTQLMDEFFGRKRSDMGCHVFGHMRQHIRPEKRPSSETYVKCFEGIARCADMESLDMVHNMMKMDSSIEPSTKLYNALMLAFTACGDPYRSLDFWTDITNSIEGPTYESLEIVFRACEIKPFGDKPAKEIWNKMRRMEIEVTPEVFSAYLGALAGQALLDEVKGLIESMGKDLGFEPDMMMFGTVYNAAPGQNRKDDIEKWAKERYPDIWAQLEKVGQRTANEGFRLFNIVRYMKA